MSAWPTFLSRLIPWRRTDSAPVPRQDAAPQLVDHSGAAISNAQSGLGGPFDAGANGRPNVWRRYLLDEELIALLRGTVYRRLVELLPQAATAKGFTLKGDPGDVSPLHKPLRDLDVLGTFRRADAWGRCLGECLVLMVVDDPAPLDQPLDPSRVTKIHRLQIYDRTEFTPVSYIQNPKDGEVGSPELYSITPRRAGLATTWQTVHHSRVLRFYGDELPPSRMGSHRTGRHRWGADAIGQVLWDAIRNIGQTSNAGATLAQELSVSVFTFARGQAAAAAGGRKAGTGTAKKGKGYFEKALNLARMKSVVGAIWMGPDDKYERVAANPSGFRDLSEEARAYLQLTTGHPAELLFGVAPSGLNTDGASWRVAWSAKVGAWQEDRYRRNLERLIEVVYYATTGAVPEVWGVEFNPLEPLTEAEKADLRTKHTMADVDAISAGILTKEEARSRYEGPTGFEYELQIDPNAPPPEPQPEPEPEPQSEERADAGPGSAVVWFPLSRQARDKHRELQEIAGNIVGVPLEVGRPHMTALYLGSIDDVAAAEAAAITADIARRHPDSRARVRGVDVFDTPNGSAIVLLLDAYEAERLEHELSRAACHLVTGRQAGRSYVPHITLGTVGRKLSATELASLRDIRITGDPPRQPVPAAEFEQQVPVGTSPWFVSLSALELKRNGEVFQFPLTGERNDAANQGVPAK